MFNTVMQKWQGVPVQVKASVAYTVCSIVQKGLAFFTTPLFTRIMTTEQYGQHSIYTSWLSILTIFLTLNLAYGSFSPAMMRFENDRRGYISAVQNISLVLCGLFLAIYLPFTQFWNEIFNLPTVMVCIMVAEILTHFAVMCWYGYKRFELKYKSVVGLTLFSAIVSPVLAIVLVMSSQEKGYARTLGYAAVSIAIGLVLFVANTVKGKGGRNKVYWKYALQFNIPLIVYYLSQVVFNMSDRIMIDHYCGTGKAGIYSLAYNISTLLIFVLNAINNSYVPWFYGKLKEGQVQENKKVSTGIAVLMAFILMGVISLAPEFTMILGGEAYYEAVWVIPPVTVSVLLLFYSQLFINTQFYYEEKTLLIWGSIGAAVLNIVLNAFLIPKLGFIAAGYTTLVSYVAFAGANYFTMRHLQKKRGLDHDAFDLRALLILLFVFVGLTAVAMLLYSLPVVRYCIIAAVLLALLVFRKPVTVFVKNTLSRK